MAASFQADARVRKERKAGSLDVLAVLGKSSCVDGSSSLAG